MNRIHAIAMLLPLALVLPGGTGAEEPKPVHSEYDRLLKKYVSVAGTDYRAWTENAPDRGALREYLAEMEKSSPSRLPRSEALAYWINLYNAATLHLVLEHYPVKSIRDIGGALSSPWKQEVVKVDGRSFTLDQIENEVIRPSFLEPRIHFALNCAARSCPPLRAEAFTGESLDTQLEEQTVAFLADPKSNSLDENGTLRLSKLFDWFEDDFREAKGSVVEFVAPYFPALTAAGSKPPKIEHEDYDWSLNEAAKPKTSAR
jgi:hypothetical protein